MNTTKLINNTEHMNVLFGDQTEGYVHLFIPRLNNLVLWHHIANWSDIMADIELYSQNYDVYIGVHLGNEMKSGKQRNKREDVKSIHCIPIDFDILDVDAHKKTALPSSTQEVLDFLKETPFHNRLYLNNSGYGIHGYILLDEPFLITDEETRIRAEFLSKNAVSYINKLAKELRGWEFDSVGDLPRLLRPLGSFNHKKGKKEPVDVLRRTNHRFTIDELEALIPSLPSQKNKKSNLLQSWQKKKIVSDKRAELEPIARGCRFMRHGIENAETLSETDWHAVITIVARCENGTELSHEVSQAYPSYSYQETAKKIEAVIASETGPVTCKYIREQLLFPACRTCPLSVSKMKSPISLGFVDGYLAGLFSRFVYDLKTKRFYEINPSMEALA